jgi:hypothetical protein
MKNLLESDLTAKTGPLKTARSICGYPALRENFNKATPEIRKGRTMVADADG